HNAGFLLVERVAEAAGASWRAEPRFQARLARGEWLGRTCLFCEPLSFMNASGEVVGAVARYHRVALDRVLVLVDDADLELGRLRLRPSGSAGGHHGLESVERHLGSRDYARLKLGIGREPGPRREITGHVLGAFNRDERMVFDRVLDRAAGQVRCWLTDGVKAAMDRFNGTVTVPETKDN
ncbi:MAG: aminoacyl-tRNA hydrolase, partial [Verrucomicrobiae bacterium]|nr:aminoacyl-tRNA hydrolase [Verrucomicrobiae bacterium]